MLSIRDGGGGGREIDAGGLCDREKCLGVIDDKDRPLDDNNSGFGGKPEGKS